VNSSHVDSVKQRKRETDLINLSIVNRTQKVFPEEITLICATINLMRRITSISKDAIDEFPKDPRLPAIMVLFSRNRELVHFATVCLANGGYATSKVLIRVELENSLSMRLFNSRADLAREWLANPERFREAWSPWRIREYLFPKGSRLLKDYNSFYGELCNYVHPNFKGWSEQTRGKMMLWHPVFNADFASECIGLIFFVMIHSLKQFADAFQQWLPDDLIKDLGRLLPKGSQMVRRHFSTIKTTK
jgi:hypothetical protein